MNDKQVIAIETSAVDIVYPETDTQLARDFLNIFQKRANGNLCLIDRDEFESITLEFAKEKSIEVSGETVAQKADSVLAKVLGCPEMKAGGALANTVHLMVNSKIDGKKHIPNAKFYSTIGADKTGEVFKNSFEEENISITEPKGQTMVVHVVPINGNRFMIPTPSKDTADKYFADTLEKLKNADFSNVQTVMIGGYFSYTGKYKELIDMLVERFNEVEASQHKPSVVLTTASHFIAGGEDIFYGLEKLSAVTKVEVFANAGEFRRLIRKDEEWRKAVPANCTPADSDYQRLKEIANIRALSFASQKYPTVTFVVTNGEHWVQVASNLKVLGVFPPPKPSREIVNTVGAGDVFAGGYLVGELMGLTIAKCIKLGFVAAEVVICQNDARLPVKEKEDRTGLLAYLDEGMSSDKQMLNEIKGMLGVANLKKMASL